MKIVSQLTTLFSFALATTIPVAAVQYPETPKEPVTDNYHGVDVTENYRWLEDGEDRRVGEWIDAQNDTTEAYLEKLPGTDSIRAAVTAIMSSEEVGYYDVVEASGVYFALKEQPPLQQAFLVTFPDANHPEQEKILFDPNHASDEGSIAIDWFEPSFDGKLVAISLSSGGSEAGDVHVFDVATGKRVFEVIPE